MRDSTIHAATTKMLISCAVTAQLICIFVFAYADCWFSNAAAQSYKWNKCMATYPDTVLVDP